MYLNLFFINKVEISLKHNVTYKYLPKYKRRNDNQKKASHLILTS